MAPPVSVSRLAAASLVPLLALAPACGGGPTEPPGPTSLSVQGGDNQTGQVGLALAQPIVVVVNGAKGPFAGATVTFTIEAGGGSVNRGTATSDATGQVTVLWSLGATLGEQRLRISSGTLSPVVIRATATTGPPAFFAPVAGNSQSAVVGQTLAIRPRVQLADAFGNPIGAKSVVFTVTGGGGQITDSVKTTGADGSAEVGSWKLGPAVATNRIQARSEGLVAEFVAFGTPATLGIASGNNQQANAGTKVPLPPTVVARGPMGEPLADVTVTFLVESGGGSLQGPTAVTNAAGEAAPGLWILGLTPGANTLRAQTVGLPPVNFTATGVPAVATAVAAASSTTQNGFFGNFLSATPAVRLTDAFGNPVAGTEVTFSALSGAGELAGAAPRSDYDGVARLRAWRLGPSAVDQQVRATVGALPPVDFSATAGPLPPQEFNIEIRYEGTTQPDSAQRAAFDNAVARWKQVILGDVSDVQVNTSGSTCNPAINELVDDLIIYAQLVEIDGAGGVLGSAGPCLIRSISKFTLVGRMRFDTADLQNLATSGRLEAVILHEMGHVIGIGTLWNTLSLLVGGGGDNPYFSGPSAGAAFLHAAGATGYNGLIVPVENTGGSGTRDSHWRESILDSELMTGFIDQGANPLSAITTTSLRDMGYVVNDAVSDPYTLPAFLRTLGGIKYELREVPLEGPIYTVGRGGQIDGVIYRR